MKGFGYLVDSKIARISETYAKNNFISVAEAMALFFDSATYQALIDRETGVYLEVFEFVYELFLEERGELTT